MKVYMHRTFTLILAAVVFGSCSLYSSGSNETVRLELQIRSQDIQSMDDIEADFTVINTSDGKVVYAFPSGCQFGYTIQNEDEIIFDSSKQLGCTAVITSLELHSGESKTYSFQTRSETNLEPGTYTLGVFLLENHSSQVEQEFAVK